MKSKFGTGAVLVKGSRTKFLRLFPKILIVIFSSLLFACPSEDTPQPETRKVLDSDIWVTFGSTPDFPALSCEKTVTYKEIKFSLIPGEKSAYSPTGCIPPSEKGDLWIQHGGALNIDVSYFSGIKTFEIYYNSGCYDSSLECSAYDLKGDLIETIMLHRGMVVFTGRFTKDLSQLKEVKLKNLCEGIIRGFRISKR